MKNAKALAMAVKRLGPEVARLLFSGMTPEGVPLVRVTDGSIYFHRGRQRYLYPKNGRKYHQESGVPSVPYPATEIVDTMLGRRDDDLKRKNLLCINEGEWKSLAVDVLAREFEEFNVRTVGLGGVSNWCVNKRLAQELEALVAWAEVVVILFDKEPAGTASEKNVAAAELRLAAQILEKGKKSLIAHLPGEDGDKVEVDEWLMGMEPAQRAPALLEAICLAKPPKFECSPLRRGEVIPDRPLGSVSRAPEKVRPGNVAIQTITESLVASGYLVFARGSSRRVIVRSRERTRLRERLCAPHAQRLYGRAVESVLARGEDRLHVVEFAPRGKGVSCFVFRKNGEPAPLPEYLVKALLFGGAPGPLLPPARAEHGLSGGQHWRFNRAIRQRLQVGTSLEKLCLNLARAGFPIRERAIRHRIEQLEWRIVGGRLAKNFRLAGGPRSSTDRTPEQAGAGSFSPVDSAPSCPDVAARGARPSPRFSSLGGFDRASSNVFNGLHGKTTDRRGKFKRFAQVKTAWNSGLRETEDKALRWAAETMGRGMARAKLIAIFHRDRPAFSLRTLNNALSRPEIRRERWVERSRWLTHVKGKDV